MDVHSPQYARRPTWAEINLRFLELNFSAVRKMLDRGVRIIAVVKADAYGHGAVRVAHCLEKCGADCLAVAILEEALELRQSGITLPILLLDGFWPGQEEVIIRNDLIPAVFRYEMVRKLGAVANRLRKTAKYQIKVDTGMSRLGVHWETAAATIQRCVGEEWTSCEGVYTHLSSAESSDPSFTILQLERFRSVVENLHDQRLRFQQCHVANSAATVSFPGSWFDCVRPGLVFYGINPLRKQCPISLQAVLSLKTRIMELKFVKKGSFVGYENSYCTPEDSLIAVLPIGYADGFSRLLSDRGHVLVRGQLAPIVGKISMDLTLVDVSKQDQIEIGDEVVLIGRQGALEITATEIASLSQTIPYETLSAISRRIPRIYKQS